MNGLTFGIRAVKKSLPFKPIRTKRAFEEVCDQIREEIQSGNLAPGDKLPSERELAEQFHVSRSTVREAFRTLEIGGVLELQKGVRGGAVVLMGVRRRMIWNRGRDFGLEGSGSFG